VWWCGVVCFGSLFCGGDLPTAIFWGDLPTAMLAASIKSNKRWKYLRTISFQHKFMISWRTSPPPRVRVGPKGWIFNLPYWLFKPSLSAGGRGKASTPHIFNVWEHLVNHAVFTNIENVKLASLGTRREIRLEKLVLHSEQPAFGANQLQAKLEVKVFMKL
jgi:hypothetical protein